MADEEWVSNPQMVEIVLGRYSMSVGRAEKLVKDAKASGEVRRRREDPLLAADDRVIAMNLRPSLLSKPLPLPAYYSKGDFIDWLGRQPSLQQPEPAAKKPGNAEPRSRTSNGR
jgi:hypothetical protein